ncbi:MAG: hypothetical protein ACI4SA_07735 [Lachnospiraceae bacterium]
MKSVLIDLKKKYDYEKFLEKFKNMNEFKIRMEYARIVNRISKLEMYVSNGIISEDVYFEHIEPLQKAQRFLEGYLARKELCNHGFTTVDGQTWEYFRSGTDIVSKYHVQ